MIEEETLDQLAALAGILPDYVDAWGNERKVGTTTKQALLKALGIEAETQGAILDSIGRLDTASWRRPLAPVVVTPHDRRARLQIDVNFAPARAEGPLLWRVEREGKRARKGRVRFSELPLIDSRTLDGEKVERRLFTSPYPLAIGYHNFHLEIVDQEGAAFDMPIIVVPRRCFGGEESASRHWALLIQLYGLRAAHDWGIGDFTDLAEIARIGAKLGADAIGLNPVHTLFPEAPANASPYSPSHREFLGVWYIDIEAVAELAECEEAQRRIADPEFQARLAALRDGPLVDYEGVAAAKRPILELLYRTFRERHLEPAKGDRVEDFQRFREAKGESLERLAVFQALAERFGPGAWRDWPEGYRAPALPDVAAFAEENRERVEFFQYLQWLAHRQLAAAAEAAREAGMAIGLYHDLAVAADSNGAEAWTYQSVLAKGATIGAPPDDWNLKGQNWGLPPYNPIALREAGYRPFIEMLRANMSHGGALRIDHVMGLERLFWIPAGGGPDQGGYVRYPVEELFGILALESQRQKCLVIGEDLGTVPDGFRERLRRMAVLSYRLLYFAQDRAREFLRPRRYPGAAAVAANTHDIATLAGYWSGRDLDVRAELGLFPSVEMKDQAYERRTKDRAALLRALKSEGLLAPEFDVPPGAPPAELVHAVFRFLARTPARLLLVDLADLLGEVEQINVPGTVSEHPNWRRRLSVALDALANDRRLVDVAAAIGEERGRAEATESGSEAR